MTYSCDLPDGEQLLIQNDGEQTLVTLCSGGENQQQSQARGIDTGKWSKSPALFRRRKELVLRLETKQGAKFLRIRGHQIQSMETEPDLQKAETVRLKKSNESAGVAPMKRLEPMRPMEPLKPLKSLQPMRSMRPMEMRMGDMHMSMGGEKAESAKRFCTRCGEPAQPDYRYCGHCGQKLASA